MGQVYQITQRRSVFVYVAGKGLPSQMQRRAEDFALTDDCERRMEWYDLGDYVVSPASDAFDFDDCDFILHEDGTHEKVDYENCGDFLDDEEKMRDFLYCSKEQFLASYSYLTETDYELTRCRLLRRFVDAIY